MACSAGREIKEWYSLTVGSSQESLLASLMGFPKVWRQNLWPELLILWAHGNLYFWGDDTKTNLKSMMLVLNISLRIFKAFQCKSSWICELDKVITSFFEWELKFIPFQWHTLQMQLVEACVLAPALQICIHHQLNLCFIHSFIEKIFIMYILCSRCCSKCLGYSKTNIMSWPREACVPVKGIVSRILVPTKTSLPSGQNPWVCGLSWKRRLYRCGWDFEM